MDQFEIKQDDTNSFYRPAIKEDIKYRKIKRAMFDKLLKSVCVEDCNLCFHGTTIWNTEKILKSGNISSQNSQISVSTVNNIWFTLKHFADLGNYNYPAGCIFVIEPADVQEIKSSTEHNLINNVYFDKVPERLKYIITTPENIKRVKQWLNESRLKIADDIVVDYDEFIEIAKEEYGSSLIK